MTPQTLFKVFTFVTAIVIFLSFYYSARLLEEASVERKEAVTYPSSYTEAVTRVPQLISKNFDVNLLAHIARETSLSDPRLLFVALWTLYFLKRIFDQVFLFRKADQHRVIDPVEVLGEFLYLNVFSTSIAYSLLFTDSTYPSLDRQPLFYEVGSLVFIVSLVLSSYVHLQLRRQLQRLSSRGRANNTHQHLIVYPRGVLFSLVTCPQHSFEFLTWVSYSVLTSFNLSVLTFTSFVFLCLVSSAHNRHKFYKRAFHGQRGSDEFPVDKPLLIPYLL